MKERPIIFSGPMIRAILEGRKTQTRRIINPRHDWEMSAREDGTLWPVYRSYVHAEPDPVEVPCPYGRTGDRLWVRESHWKFTGCDDDGKPWPGFIESPNKNPYNAICYDDYENIKALISSCAAVRVPSIHMPRWASRITLEITEVRAHTLRSISAEDCAAEGLQSTLREHDAVCDLRQQWRELWESIHGAGSWSDNPWVWALTFRRVTS